MFVTSSARDTETKDNLLTVGQNGLNMNIMRRIFHSFKSKIILVLLWLFYFIFDNNHTFGKQMPPDLALLLTFSIKNVDRLDNKNQSLYTNIK